MADWYSAWRARLAAGDGSPLPPDAAWWAAWAAAVRAAPSVAEGRALGEREARAPPLRLGAEED